MHYNCHSCFSLRNGTLSVDALLDLAEAKGVDSLALTDINNTSAGLDFLVKARQRGIRPVLGIEFRLDNRLLYIGLARSVRGWRSLCEFLSRALHAAALGHGPRIAEEGLAPLNPTGPAQALPASLRKLQFPGRAPHLPDTFFIYPFAKAPPPDQLRDCEFVGLRPVELNRLFTSAYKSFPQKLLNLTPVTFANKVGFNTHRLLRCIDRNTILSKQNREDVAAADEFMHSPTDLQSFYQAHPYMLDNSRELLEKCTFEMSFEQHKNKVSFTGSRYDDRLLLEKLCWDGVAYRYGGQEQRPVTERVKKELRIIDQMGFSAYFLITWDFIRYGQGRGFFHVGRGSGANSIVAYCIGITDVDPIELNLYFERFLNPHRSSPPDFDIDFSWKDRDDVIDYVFKRYGQAHTSLMATYNTFKGRSIIRELGKVFGLPKAEIDQLVARRHAPQIDDQIVRLIYRFGRELEGLPNHLGIHPGGILISEEPIRTYSATDLPPKGFPIVQFDMFVAEAAGLYKYDVLSQRGLGHIKDSALVVEENCGVSVDVHQVGRFKSDPKIADLVKRGDSIGCFYVESPAMRQLLRKLNCDNYLCLVAASSVIRPGVAKSGMMRQYIERHRKKAALERRGEFKENDPDWYLHPKMGDILGETYGVMVYQEDVIKVAHHFGGVSLADADVLRRGMSGKYRSKDHFEGIREEYFKNCRKMDYAEEVSQEVWRQMESFSGYSFCKAHSASFAVESYQSLYFKAHYPREFMVGVINNFGGFYQTEVYVHEARRAGAEINLPCINQGRYLTSIQGKRLFLGFVHVQGLEKRVALALVAERAQTGPFRDLEDLIRRVPMGLETLSMLIRAGALRFLGRSKKSLLWQANLQCAKQPRPQPKAALFASTSKNWALPNLPDDPVEDLYDELELLGFAVSQGASGHRPPIFALLACPLDRREIRAADFERLAGQIVLITGYLICTKRVRTSKGDMMGFSDFIDARGDYFDAVLFPDVYGRSAFAGTGVYQLQGKLIADFGVVTLEVREVERLGYLGDPRRD